MKPKDIFLHILKIAAAVAIVWYMLSSGLLNINTIVQGARDNIGLIVLVFFVLLFAAVITFYRWKLLLEGQKIFLSMREVTSLGFIGLFFTTILPGGVGGDVIKSVYIAKKTKSQKTASVLTVILDRIIGLAALVMICTLGLFINIRSVARDPALRSLGLIIIAMLLALMIMTFLGLSRRVNRNRVFNKIINKLPFSEMFNKVYQAFHAYRDEHKYLTYALLISFFNHALNITAFYLITRALGFNELSIYSYLFIVPIGMITTALPITPAGIGIGQAAFLKLFEWSLGARTTIGAEAITIWQAISIVIFMLGGYFYITYKKDLSKKNS